VVVAIAVVATAAIVAAAVTVANKLPIQYSFSAGSFDPAFLLPKANPLGLESGDGREAIDPPSL